MHKNKLNQELKMLVGTRNGRSITSLIVNILPCSVYFSFDIREKLD